MTALKEKHSNSGAYQGTTIMPTTAEIIRDIRGYRQRIEDAEAKLNALPASQGREHATPRDSCGSPTHRIEGKGMKLNRFDLGR